MPLIDLDKLYDDPRNANVLDADGLAKLKASITHSQTYAPLLVRPHPNLAEQFVIVDGHHRKQVAQTLGWSQIECYVLTIDEATAGLLLLTFNRLRGTDIPRKRAELIQQLLPSLPVEDLTLLIPESKAEIEGLLALLQQDTEALETALEQQLAAERASLPVPFGFMVPANDASIVEEAIQYYQGKTKTDQGLALVAICRDVLAMQEVNHD